MKQPFETLSPRPRRLRRYAQERGKECNPYSLPRLRTADCSAATGWISACTEPTHGYYECEWKPGGDSRRLVSYPTLGLDNNRPSHGRRTATTSRMTNRGNFRSSRCIRRRSRKLVRRSGQREAPVNWSEGVGVGSPLLRGTGSRSEEPTPTPRHGSREPLPGARCVTSAVGKKRPSPSGLLSLAWEGRGRRQAV